MAEKLNITSGPVFGLGTAIFICWLLFWDFGGGPDLYDAIRTALLRECPAVVSRVEAAAGALAAARISTG